MAYVNDESKINDLDAYVNSDDWKQFYDLQNPAMRTVYDLILESYKRSIESADMYARLRVIMGDGDDGLNEHLERIEDPEYCDDAQNALPPAVLLASVQAFEDNSNLQAIYAAMAIGKRDSSIYTDGMIALRQNNGQAKFNLN